MAVAFHAPSITGYMGGDVGVIPRQCLELVLVTIDEYRGVFEICGKILHLRAVNEFLTLQHTAEQQADNDQHDGDFDQGKAGLIAFHCATLLMRFRMLCQDRRK